jgi:nucleoside-diphosphate-sugar epimerase
MTKALIGYTGFVGSTLLRQQGFDSLYRSTNINDIRGQSFDTVICAGAPAQKWIANKAPEEDLAKIQGLIDALSAVQCKRFILISTVDVFQESVGMNESSATPEAGVSAYGLHRRLLEKFVQTHFEDQLIVRLPGLVGPGLRKNVIYDFLNDNNLHAIDSRGVFQFYPMVNLSADLATAQAHGLKLLHLTAEPISVADVSALGFGKPFEQPMQGAAARYDFQTEHAALFGGRGAYQYAQRESVMAIRAYAQSEPKAAPK